MKSRLATLGLMICTLLAVAASGQDRFQQKFFLQDDSTGSYLGFDLSGSYLYVGCDNDAKFEGVGRVTISGCKVTLEALAKYRLVQAEADMCAGVGKASILQQGPCPLGRDCEPLQFTISDSNMKDSAPECKKPDPK